VNDADGSGRPTRPNALASGRPRTAAQVTSASLRAATRTAVDIVATAATTRLRTASGRLRDS
jgi:hypothetical protein